MSKKELISKIKEIIKQYGSKWSDNEKYLYFEGPVKIVYNEKNNTLIVRGYSVWKRYGRTRYSTIGKSKIESWSKEYIENIYKKLKVGK